MSGPLVRGKSDSPILFCSDAVTSDVSCFDWISFKFTSIGVLDHAIIQDCNGFGGPTENSLTARSYFYNHLESGRNGPGWVIACYLSNGNNEGIGTLEKFQGTSANYFIFHNILSGFHHGVLLAYPNTVYAKHNSFFDMRNASIGVRLFFDGGQEIVISGNNFLPPIGNTGGIANNSTQNIDITNNYWNTTIPSEIEALIKDNTDDPALDVVNYTPFLTSPDSDLDGLTDEEEAQLVTDPKIMDTDQDFVIDGLEVNTYHTNPLKQDTDNDGTPDGIEVFNNKAAIFNASIGASWFLY